MWYCGGVTDVQLLEPETPVGDVPVGGDPVGLLGAAADALQGLDREALTGRELGELLVGLHRQKNRLLAGELGVVRAFERRGTWQIDGATSAARWLARKLRAPLPELLGKITITHQQTDHLLAHDRWSRIGDPP
jgi:hypothetical protein